MGAGKGTEGRDGVLHEDESQGQLLSRTPSRVLRRGRSPRPGLCGRGAGSAAPVNAQPGPGGPRVGDDRPDGAQGECGAQVGMAVGALAVDGDEQGAFGGLAGVGDDRAGHRCVRADEPAAHGGCDLTQGEVHPRPHFSSTASAMTGASL
ncbi:hypothetical protein HMPREF0975_00086 [Actinomyces sp. oral taxon 849 str. F0330]|nr:hypothetical protein HMPREF0975_00086 [Actinomyces sp. oral taxon 849 str. F0330]